ncbi:KfrB domain-containing protein [Bartonella sp. DGB2]|uniref:KfrB domain-containing protein n=1 Tax=Bartonella sp. DGB2 TaxID=3388426 RepID=UPI003990173F
MQERLLVMNGYSIVQSVKDDEWINESVFKADGLKAGVYNLFKALPANLIDKHVGLIIYFDDNFLYQETETALVKHDRERFFELPEIGKFRAISYGNDGNAIIDVISHSSSKLKR